MELSGKHAVITGGGSGIGAAIAERLAAAGAALTLIGRDRHKVAEKSASLPVAQSFSADVADPAQITAALAAATVSFGPVSILINNAGVATAQPFLEMDIETWRTSLDVNLNGVFYATQAVLPGMIARAWGRVITIASTAGLIPYKQVSAYVAAKHGVIGLTRALALEFASSGVTVNAVCPGYTETDMALTALNNLRRKTGRDETEARAMLAAKNPQGRLIQPDEVAENVVWLCSDAARSITGQSIAICGGEVMV